MKKIILTTIGGLVVLGLFIGSAQSDFSLFPILLVAFGIILVVTGLKGNSKKATTKQGLPLLSKEREEHYQNTGMSQSEIEYFRDTMGMAKEQIEQLQKNINKNAKLKAIDLRRDTLRAAKALFKELVKEPQKLHCANHFLYTHLPNMVDLTDKFIEINEHEIKSRETYEKIEESAQIIDQMASLIAQDYQQFVADDFEEMDVELSIAKQSLKRDNINSTVEKI